MQDRSLIKLKERALNGSLQGDEFDALGFDPTIYQRIFFMEDRTTVQARNTLRWLWRNIRRESFLAGNREGIAVVAYPLSDDFQNWELFADVSDKVADAAIVHSAALIDEVDSLDRAITARADHPSSYVLPNRMLVEQGLFSDWFSLFQTADEIITVGSKMKNINIHRPA